MVIWWFQELVNQISKIVASAISYSLWKSKSTSWRFESVLLQLLNTLKEVKAKLVLDWLKKIWLWIWFPRTCMFRMMIIDDLNIDFCLQLTITISNGKISRGEILMAPFSHGPHHETNRKRALPRRASEMKVWSPFRASYHPSRYLRDRVYRPVLIC